MEKFTVTYKDLKDESTGSTRVIIVNAENAEQAKQKVSNKMRDVKVFGAHPTEMSDKRKGVPELKEAVDNKELLAHQQKVAVAKTTEEEQEPVFADATRNFEKTAKVKEETVKVEKAPEHNEKPKRPKMVPGAKKMHLDESLFEDAIDKEVKSVRNFMTKSGMPPKKSAQEHKKFLTKLHQVRDRNKVNESVDGIVDFDKVFPVVQEWLGDLLGQDDLESAAQSIAIALTRNASDIFSTVRRSLMPYIRNVVAFEEIEGIVPSIEDAINGITEARVGKTKEIKVLQGNYGYGWDDLIEYDVKDFNGNILDMNKEIKNDLRDYRENERDASHRVITRRVPVLNESGAFYGRQDVRDIKVVPGYHEWVLKVDGKDYYSFGDVTDNLGETNEDVSGLAEIELDEFNYALDRYFNSNEEISNFFPQAKEIGDLSADEIDMVHQGIIDMYNYYLSESLKEDWTWEGDKVKIADEMERAFIDIDKSYPNRKSSNIITRDEFDEQFALAARKVLGIDNIWELQETPIKIDGKEEDIFDIETDIRTILSMSGWETVFEGENEGGLQKLTEALNEDFDTLEKEFDNFLNTTNYIDKEKDYYIYTFYADYNDRFDERDVAKMLNSTSPLDYFYEHLDDAYIDSYGYAVNELLVGFKDYLKSKNIEIPEDFEESFNDLASSYVSFQPDYKHFLGQEFKCRIDVDTGDGSYDFTLNPNYYNNYTGSGPETDENGIDKPASLVWLAETQGYSLDQLRQALAEGDIKNPSGFLQSVRQEAVNTMSSMNMLTFLCKATLGDLLNWASNKSDIRVPKSIMCGLFDSWNGSGSVLEIELEKDIVIPKDYIRAFTVDAPGGTYDYSADDVYGLSSSAYNTPVEVLTTSKIDESMSKFETRKRKLVEGAKSFLRTLGRDDIQYFTHKNRFNYDLKQIRIDNKNKTYEYGNFAWTNRQESTQNGKEFERLVDKLKEMGYTEIKKSLKERLAKRK